MVSEVRKLTAEVPWGVGRESELSQDPIAGTQHLSPSRVPREPPGSPPYSSKNHHSHPPVLHHRGVLMSPPGALGSGRRRPRQTPRLAVTLAFSGTRLVPVKLLTVLCFSLTYLPCPRVRMLLGPGSSPRTWHSRPL